MEDTIEADEDRAVADLAQRAKERVFNLGPDARLDLLQLVHDCADRPVWRAPHGGGTGVGQATENGASLD